MRRKLILLIFILFQTYSLSVWSEITFKPLFDKSDKLFANKILEIMPSLNNLRIGNPSAENVIIEFIDYNCGYCKAIHNEIISLTNDQDLDLVVYFYQFPILSESSRIYSKILSFHPSFIANVLAIFKHCNLFEFKLLFLFISFPKIFYFTYIPKSSRIS